MNDFFFWHTTIVTVCVFICVCHVFSYNLFYFDFHSARITDSKSCQIIESVLKYKNAFKTILCTKKYLTSHSLKIPIVI